jgi:hypothetical protein
MIWAKMKDSSSSKVKTTLRFITGESVTTGSSILQGFKCLSIKSKMNYSSIHDKGWQFIQYPSCFGWQSRHKRAHSSYPVDTRISRIHLAIITIMFRRTVVIASFSIQSQNRLHSARNLLINTRSISFRHWRSSFRL